MENAEKLVNELLNNSEKAQAEKDRQLAVVSANRGMVVVALVLPVHLLILQNQSRSYLD